MDKDLVVLVVALLVLNGATMKLLTVVLGKVDLGSALREKANDATAPPGAGDTSYSRLSGLIGAVILATFFWAAANVVIYKMLYRPDDVTALLNGIGTYVLGGASLFVPYAANQLREAFRPAR